MRLSKQLGLSLTELNSDLCVLQTTTTSSSARKSIFVAVVTFRPPAVVTARGQCRNAGSSLQPVVSQLLRNSLICRA